MEFSLSKEEEIKYLKWLKKHNKKCPNVYVGAIGGRITFSFTPTGLGPITTIKCECGEKLDLTEIENW